jgi:hypothetical protein
LYVPEALYTCVGADVTEGAEPSPKFHEVIGNTVEIQPVLQPVEVPPFV